MFRIFWIQPSLCASGQAILYPLQNILSMSAAGKSVQILAKKTDSW